jgi:hypothetical protein
MFSDFKLRFMEYSSVDYRKLRDFWLIFYSIILFFYLLHNQNFLNIPILIRSVFFFLSIVTFSCFVSNFSKFFYAAWMIAGECLGVVNSRIILIFFFYSVFVPFSFILKVLKKDPMSRELAPSVSSYRVVGSEIMLNKYPF